MFHETTGLPFPTSALLANGNHSKRHDAQAFLTELAPSPRLQVIPDLVSENLSLGHPSNTTNTHALAGIITHDALLMNRFSCLMLPQN